MSLSIERLQALSPQRLVLLAAELQARIEAVERRQSEPIAVVGIGCRFPGGVRDTEGFWRFLRGGDDAIDVVPPDRWDIDAYFDPDPDAPGRMSTRMGGFIDGVDRFDAAFFGIAPREAEGMDPQQRLLLEVAWEAIERAGQSPERLMHSRTGVFVGISGSDYYQVCKAAGGDAGLDAYSASGAAHSIAAGRLAYVLGLQGPNLAVDTACSSSLVAVHLAIQSLRRGECDMALAGGVNAILAPDTSITLSKLRMMAPDGRCKVFDAAADGFVRGEGCGLLVLRRLADAVARRDPVVAVIRGSAINNDGRSHGLTAPNGPAQEAVLRAALADAGVAPAGVDFVETHGTGTALGDPIELQALGEVYGPGRDRPLMVGSVKTNIGHLESAAGIAGLIKAVLALASAEVPPHLHLQTPNPYIPWSRLPITVPTTVAPWPSADRPRRAAVSSFGFSGTNVHVILEAAPDTSAATADAVVATDGVADRPRHIFTLSARSEPALRALAERYAAHPAVTGAPLADVCFTAAAGRSHFGHRLAFAVQTPDALQDTLAAVAAGGDPPGLHRGHASPARVPKIAFLFTGQGAQYVGMGRQLYATEPTFGRAIDRAEALLRPHLDRPLTSVLFPDQGDPAAGSAAIAALDDTTYTQAALFAVGYALAEMWRAWGVTPAWVMGHSVGELAAACAAGFVSLEDGARLIAARGRLMGALPRGGAMAAVFADADRVQGALAPYADRVAIAAYNGPDNVVVSGPSTAMDDLLADLAGRGFQARGLSVSHAFHSPLMDPMLDAWTAAAAGMTPRAPTAGLVSNVTGRPAAAADLADPNYWRRHAREPVRFADGMRALREQGCDVFVEIGPNPVLLGMAARCVSDEAVGWLPSLRRGRDDWAVMLDSVAELYVRGAPIDWEGFDRDRARRRRVLPTYPFERERYWVKTAPFQPAPGPSGSINGGRREDVDGRRIDVAPPSEPDRVSALLHEILWRRMPDRPSTNGRWDEARSRGTQGGKEARAVAEPVDMPAAPATWLILADRGGLGVQLADRLRTDGTRCVVATVGRSFAAAGADAYEVDPTSGADLSRLIRAASGPDRPPLAGVACLWALDAVVSEADPAGALLDALQRIVGGALHLVQALLKDGPLPPPRLWLITRGARAVDTTSNITSSGTTTSRDQVSIIASYSSSAPQAALWGFGQVVDLEHPELRCGLLDLDPTASPASDLAALLAVTGEEGGREAALAMRQGNFYAPRLVRWAPASGATSSLLGPPVFRPDATYVITGGLGGLGLRVARWLVENGARHLVLLGRHAGGSNDGSGGSRMRPEMRAAIDEMEALGAVVVTARADVADRDRLAAVLDDIADRLPPVRGIVHAAGVLADAAILNQSWARFAAVMAPKVVGTQHLVDLTRGLALDFMALFSSGASVLGSAGQANYAAANAFLDAMAHDLRTSGVPAVSINWGAWAEIGVAARTGITARSVNVIMPGDGLAALGAALGGGAASAGPALAQLAVLPMDGLDFWTRFEGTGVPPLLAELAPASRPGGRMGAADDGALDLRRRLAAVPPNRRLAVVLGQVRAHAAVVLGLATEHVLDAETPLSELGLDSLMAVELRNRLGRAVGETLPATLLFEHPTIHALAGMLIAKLSDLEKRPEDTASA